MTAVGFTFCASGLSVDPNPYVFIVGAVFSQLPFALLFHMLAAFPSARLEDRFARAVVALGYFTTTGLLWAILLVYDTTRDDSARNPIMAWDRQSLADVLLDVQSVLAIVAVTGTSVVLWRRWRGSARVQRQVLAPVYGTAALLIVLLLLSLVANFGVIPDAVETVIDVAGLVCLVLVPFAFLGGLLRSRLTRAGAVTDLVASLSERQDRRRSLRDALAEALGDPMLTLAYWLPDREEYVNAEGRPVTLPGPEEGCVATIVEQGGEPVAAIVHDASLQDERRLVAAVGAAATLTLENERLEAELRASVEELREQRRRSLEAALDERRRLERNLHDGAQQRLVSIALKLRLARTRLDDREAAGAILSDAAEELDGALEELRELARGIHPAVLSDRGLDAALEALAHRSPVPVELEATPGVRLPEAVELAAYFVVAEALTNMAKYASATRATVRAIRENGHVVVEVADDGVGGADPGKGSGLNGLADRLCAVDGRLEVMDGRRGGTVVRADIPC
jgi:signal transduction histidine kinase